MEKRYRVVYTCKIQPEATKADVVRKAASIFKISPEKAEIFVASQKPRIIKKNLPLKVAKQYEESLIEIGLQVELKEDIYKKDSPSVSKNTISSHKNKGEVEPSKSNDSVSIVETEKIETSSLYAPPKSNLVDSHKTNENIVRMLKSQSTWLLFFLSFITIGIYSAHYIKRQTLIINSHLHENDGISVGYVNFILILSYMSLLLIIPSIILEDGHVILIIGDVVNKGWSVLILVWAFFARSKMNWLLNASKKNQTWFHGFWTFLFQTLYFNYKINLLNENDSF